MEDEQSGAALAMRTGGGLDLSRAPWQQWNAEMVELAKRTVLRDAKRDSEVYYCLALAEGLGLNPFANEVFFIRRKGSNGQESGGVIPYVGREGLVKKADERAAWFEVDTVRENDEFSVHRAKDGTRTVEHSYSGGSEQRGAIVGAWALLHFRDGTPPGFFYAPLEEYLPTFDAEWKMRVSPWGNQRSSMIEKCAMIAAARQRIHLAGVLVDAEVDRVQQMGGGGGPLGDGAESFDFDSLPPALRDRYRDAIERANSLEQNAYTGAQLQMILGGREEEELLAIVEGIERENEERAATRAPGPADDDGEGAAPEAVSGEVLDQEGEEREVELTTLRGQRDLLLERLDSVEDPDTGRRIQAELEVVEGKIRELGGDVEDQDRPDADR